MSVEEGWHDTGEELTITYAPVTVEDDGTRILVASGPVPDGIPIEIHVLGRTQIKAIYSDEYVDDDPVPMPGQESN